MKTKRILKNLLFENSELKEINLMETPFEQFYTLKEYPENHHGLQGHGDCINCIAVLLGGNVISRYSATTLKV